MENLNSQATSEQPTQTIIIERQNENKNGMGLAGFILSLIAVVICWIPIICWIVGVLGGIFSIIGLFKKPRGFAIAGIVITFFFLILKLGLLGLLGGALLLA